MSDPNDDSIPVLHQVLVPGRAPQTRDVSGAAATPAGQPTAGSAPQAPTPLDAGMRRDPAFAPQPAHAAQPPLSPEPEPVLAPQPVLTPEELATPEPVLAPQPLPNPDPANVPVHDPAMASAPQSAPPVMPVSNTAAQAELYRPHVADHTHAKTRPRPHHGVHVRHGHDDVHEEMEVSPGVFDRGEPPVPVEAGATVPPDFDYEAEHDAAHGLGHDTTRKTEASPPVDAELVAERLRARVTGFLTGDGRGIIEARCRDALQQHTSLLVDQITTEVVRTLETEMTGWVREAVEDEIARRSGRA
ncbi:DUF2486 family protein [Paraburkholderia sp.]|uniref:DUF2486 family protein n=1 Tax=Paraburkholderia sp. TaxID=1926495 RepID=UPI002F3E7631